MMADPSRLGLDHQQVSSRNAVGNPNETGRCWSSVSRRIVLVGYTLQRQGGL